MVSRSVCIALGGNLGQPAETFARALALLAERVGPLRGVSRLFRTAPLNPPELIATSQPEFLNAAARFESSLAAGEILAVALEVERMLGRNRAVEQRWGPRTIDLDLILIGDEVVTGPTITVPHPEAHRRDFVLVPLAEIAAEMIHPLLGKSVGELLAHLRASGEALFTLEVAGALPEVSPGAAPP